MNKNLNNKTTHYLTCESNPTMSTCSYTAENILIKLSQREVWLERDEREPLNYERETRRGGGGGANRGRSPGGRRLRGSKPRDTTIYTNKGCVIWIRTQSWTRPCLLRGRVPFMARRIFDPAFFAARPWYDDVEKFRKFSLCGFSFFACGFWRCWFYRF